MSSFLGGQEHRYCISLGCLALRCVRSSEPDGSIDAGRCCPDVTGITGCKLHVSPQCSWFKRCFLPGLVRSIAQPPCFGCDQTCFLATCQLSGTANGLASQVAEPILATALRAFKRPPHGEAIAQELDPRGLGNEGRWKALKAEARSGIAQLV